MLIESVIFIAAHIHYLGLSNGFIALQKVMLNFTFGVVQFLLHHQKMP